MHENEFILDLSDAEEKRYLVHWIQKLLGPHRIRISRSRRIRTSAQNRLYWVAIVQPFAEFLREQGEDYTPEMAHEVLKFKFLRHAAIHPHTGEIIGGRVRSTTELNTDDFSAYVEKCSAWLAEMGIVVSLPGDKAFA